MLARQARAETRVVLPEISSFMGDDSAAWSWLPAWPNAAARFLVT